MSNNEKDLDMLRAHFSAVSSLKIDAILDTFHPDIIIKAPFTPEVFKARVPDKIQGKEAVSKFFKSLLDLVAPLNFFDLEIEPLQKPGEFVCRFASDTKILATNLPYRNHYISRISVRDGLIIGISEYYDPIVLITSLGGGVTLPQMEEVYDD